MSCKRFDEVVEKALREAGWFPGRRISTDRLKMWETELAQHGVCLNRFAKEFLIEFGDLEIRTVCKPYDITLVVNPTRDIFFEFPTKEYEPEIGVRLSPLGEEPRYLILAVGDNGTVYWLGDWYWIVAESLDEAINKIVLNIPCSEG